MSNSCVAPEDRSSGDQQLVVRAAVLAGRRHVQPVAPQQWTVPDSASVSVGNQPVT
jgi:hypothetical protein